jgi:ADP-heptose:LPS heptosyltransferase
MRDFAASAVLMSQLDLMISIDSAPAHLAGALGVPLWVMLGPGQADYRWGGTSGASPWYPKARLFRAGAGGWPALATDIAAALCEVNFA